jgi:hypothetical protein
MNEAVQLEMMTINKTQVEACKRVRDSKRDGDLFGTPLSRLSKATIINIRHLSQ